MQINLLLFIFGLGATEWFSDFWVFCFLIFWVGLIFVCWKFGPNFALRKWIFFLAFFLLGFSYPFLYEQITQPWSLPQALIKKNILVEGFIDSIPKIKPRLGQFDFLVVKWNSKKERFKIQLSWYRDDLQLRAGERCFFTVRLKPVHGLQNPGSFDFEKYLKSNGIRARGYVVDRQNPYCEKNQKFTYFLLRTRQRIENAISKAVHVDGMPGLISALTVGSRTLMGTQQWKILQNTGTSHLMAISGLHVAFIAGLIFGVVNFLWRLSSFLPQFLPAQKAAALISMIGAVVYGLLAGFSLPTQRAVIMIVVLIAFEYLNKSTTVMQRLIWAAFIILVFQPLAISQISFWLSFAAVAWICFGMMGYERSQKWKMLLRMQLVCFLGLLPLTLLYFQKMSMVTFFANALAIPWVGFVIVPLCFLASLMMIFSVPIAQLLFSLAAYLFWPLWKILMYLSALPFSVWHQSLFHPFIFISCSAAVILLLAPKGWPGRALGFIFILPLFFYMPERPQFSEVFLTILDVGQGLAVVIQTQHHTLVYDAGPKSFGGFDAGEAVVLPFLERHRIPYLDGMIISHGDIDHLGGAPAILSTIPTKMLLTSEPSKLSRFHAQNCVDGQSWDWDGVHFALLNPPKNEAYLRNDSSCVLQIETLNQRLLLPGDIEKNGEQNLVERYGNRLKSSVLIAPHHGSKTSSTESFLSHVQPEYIIAANGFYNAFGFPSRQVLARYAAFHAKLLDTATLGAIEVRMKIHGLHVEALKK